MQQEAATQPANKGPAPETPRKRHGRRAVVYHKESSAESLPLYPKSRSGTDSVEGYKKSLSDEYKRRAYEEAERNREKLYELGAGGYSIECYVASLAFTAAIIALLIVYIATISQTSLKETVSRLSVAPDRTNSFVVMTENLDCSLLAKRTFLKRRVKDFVSDAIMCLTATVPYCAAATYSTSSSFLYIRLSTELMLINWRDLMDPSGLETWSKGIHDHVVVSIHIADGSPKKLFTGDDSPREKWLRNKAKAVKAGIENTEPIYRVSHSLMKQLKRFSGKNVEKWMSTFNVSRDLPPTRQFIKVNKANTKQFAGGIREELIGETEYGKNLLIYTRRDSIETFSLFSAFVVKAIIKSNKLKASRVDFLYNFLLAQKFAFLHFPNCTEFTGTSSRSSTSQSLMEMVDKFKEGKTLAAPIIRIENLRRITSLLVWRRTRYISVVHTVAMSRPFPFDSNFSRVPKQEDFTYFVSGNETSVNFTAAAYLMIRFDTGRNKEITHVATASGSIRTVEAVALAILNLFKGETPDKVVAMKSAYYDIRDGKFYCEDKDDIAELLAVHKLVCYEIPKDDFDANDRVLMVAALSEHSNAVHTSINAAMSSRDEDDKKDHNEPVFF